MSLIAEELFRYLSNYFSRISNCKSFNCCDLYCSMYLVLSQHLYYFKTLEDLHFQIAQSVVNVKVIHVDVSVQFRDSIDFSWSVIFCVVHP